MAGKTLAKHICNWWQAVVGLVGGDVVDVRCVGQLGRLVLNVAGQRVRVVHAGECLAERS